MMMNYPDNENENNQNQDNQRQDNQNRDERNEELNDQEQSQTDEEPSEFSGVAHAAMEGTTEQDALAQAYEAARPSFELETDENREEGNENDDQ
jgi:hypothetical protein